MMFGLCVSSSGFTLEGHLTDPDHQQAWAKVCVTQVDLFGGVDVRFPIFRDGDRLLSINDVPAVQLKLKEIANILCAGCDKVMVKDVGRQYLNTPAVKYGGWRRVKILCHKLLYGPLYGLGGRLSGKGSRTAKERALERLAEVVDAEQQLHGGESGLLGGAAVAGGMW